MKQRPIQFGLATMLAFILVACFACAYFLPFTPNISFTVEQPPTLDPTSAGQEKSKRIEVENKGASSVWFRGNGQQIETYSFYWIKRDSLRIRSRRLSRIGKTVPESWSKLPPGGKAFLLLPVETRMEQATITVEFCDWRGRSKNRSSQDITINHPIEIGPIPNSPLEAIPTIRKFPNGGNR